MSTPGRVRISAMIAERISTKIDRGNLILLGLISALFLGCGIFLWTREPSGWEFVLVIAVILSVPWAGALSVRFSFSDAHIEYRSLFRHLRLETRDVTGIEVVAERKTKAPQGVPRFHLILYDGRKEPLNVKLLPIKVVQRFCSFLRAKGIPITVQDAFVARRMASRIMVDENVV